MADDAIRYGCGCEWTGAPVCPEHSELVVWEPVLLQEAEADTPHVVGADVGAGI